ncbi:hypothetical protein [Alteribacter natronophilus]|uniref:hypothetical protein n=1 Tax=Alteribacter natronophilus TaxID=2583810 RepID=UPI00110EC43B|nr:hypothetical protein [Alteribacter natronophilus]TMW70877.1 hypothetical protein FGB90_12900 [Alteribacter natronophilus]
MKKLIVIVLIAVNMLWMVPLPAGAEAGGKEEASLTVVLVPGLSLKDVEWLTENGDHPSLWETGFFGAVNVKGEGAYSYLNNAVSIGAGGSSTGITVWNGYKPGEKLDGTRVEDLYEQWTGKKTDEPIYHPHVRQLVDKNEASLRPSRVGAFGEELKAGGVSRHVYGHSDTRSEPVRFGALLAMDEEGFVDTYTDRAVEKNRSRPSGMRMNPEKLLEEIGGAAASAFHAVEWGDLHRLYSESPNMTPVHFKNQHVTALKELEQFIHMLSASTDHEIWLLSPAVNAQALAEKSELAPLWVWEQDRGARGNWYAGTTRRDQLAAVTDLVPSWMAFYGISPQKQWNGVPLMFTAEQAETGPLFDTKGFFHRLAAVEAVYAGRGPVLSGYVTVLVVLLVGVSLVLWLRPESAGWRRGGKLVLTGAVSSPLWFLVTGPLVPELSTPGYVTMIALLGAGTAFLAERLPRHGVSVVCGLFFTAATVDLLLGAPLIQRSFLGYDPVIGARFYGIGNEFAGVYIVSGWLMMVPLFRGDGSRGKVRTGVVLTVLVAMLLFLAASGLGANAGASLATGLMIGFIVWRVTGVKVSVRRFFLFAPAVLTVLLGLLYVLQLGQPASHIHSAFEVLFKGDVQAIGKIVLRKLEMNWKIFKISHWTELFVTTYLLTGVYVWRKKRKVLGPEKGLAVQGCIVASVALLLLNDSGIVAAATSMFVTLCASYAWLLEEKPLHSEFQN